MAERANIGGPAGVDAELVDKIAEAVAERLRGQSVRRAMFELHARWSDAHQTLGSFACDNARALRILAWAPDDGPFAGVPLGERDPLSLTPEDVDAYVAWRRKTTTRRKGPPSPALINREVMMLKRVLNFAVSRRTITHSPLEGIDDLDENNIRDVIVEEDGFEAILGALGTDLVMRAIVTLGYDSGMRKTELLEARRPWLEPERWRVHIPAAIAKNGEKRIADLSPRALEAIEALPRHFATDLLFPNPDTRKPYDGRWIHEKFVRAVDFSGVVGRDGRKPRLHDLRRSWITIARRRGVPESVIMAKSGHKDHKVFRRYSIVDDEDLAEAWRRMERGRQSELAALAAKRRGPHRATTRNDAPNVVEKKTTG